MVTYKTTVVLFGGELANGTLMNDIWSFNMSKSKWKLLPNNGSGIPPGLASHTANVVGDKLIIFGGMFSKIIFYFVVIYIYICMLWYLDRFFVVFASGGCLRLCGSCYGCQEELKQMVDKNDNH